MRPTALWRTVELCKEVKGSSTCGKRRCCSALRAPGSPHKVFGVVGMAGEHPSSVRPLRAQLTWRTFFNSSPMLAVGWMNTNVSSISSRALRVCRMDRMGGDQRGGDRGCTVRPTPASRGDPAAPQHPPWSKGSCPGPAPREAAGCSGSTQQREGSSPPTPPPPYCRNKDCGAESAVLRDGEWTSPWAALCRVRGQCREEAPPPWGCVRHRES